MRAPIIVRICCAVELTLLLWTAPADCSEIQHLPPVRVPAPSTDLPAKDAPPANEVLSLEAAIRVALERNPELAVARKQAGVAAADMVIARTYPFNPVLEGTVRGVSAPESAGITNHTFFEHKLFFTLELHHQRRIRREAAGAALSRVEWEIVQAEVDVALRTVRAYQNVVYRHQKLQMLEDAVALNQRTAEQVNKLRQLGKLASVDSLMIRGEVMDAKAQISPGRNARTMADQELRRLLLWGQDPLHLQGNLTAPPVELDAKDLSKSALSRRPDLQARQAALSEAEAKLRLERANRFGNPTIGPAYELNEVKVSFIGVQYALPMPVFNQRRGEILKAQADMEKVALDIRKVQVDMDRSLQAALERVQEAQVAVETYKSEALPILQKNMEDAEKLFQQGEPGVDVLRILDFRRRLLRARDGYLDAQWELALARADLAAAVGDPALALVAPKVR